MRLLDRYLLRELLLPLGYCLSGFLIVWISFDLFENIDKFQEHRLTIPDVAEYYLVLMPETLLVALPIGLLLAMLYALANHARHNELVAIRGAGVSLWRVGAPYFATGVLLSVLLFALNDIWLPDSGAAADDILTRRLGREASTAEKQWHRNLNFRNDREHRVWSIGAYNPETYELRHAMIEWALPDGSRRQIFAETGGWIRGRWVFQRVVQFTYRSPEDSVPMRQQLPELELHEFSETPEQIKSEIKISGLSSVRAARNIRLSVAEIMEYLRLHPHLEGENYALLYTQLHGRLAAPWTCLVVVLIALPFGALASGRRNVMVGVASSIFICFTYFVVSRFGLALGTSGHLPPWIAAWAPNAMFAAAGIWLIRRVQ